ncbi:NAD dependent epimerase/dehydratase family protein [Klebsiella pneumoniae]|nr:NAD dependent epimerase/dehydratase family protein [Klebsiella pneumoniae]
MPVTELRAGIIVGAGSAAFEVMRDMVYNLPVLTPPRWVRSRTTPVALENLLVDLVELLNHPSDAHRVFEAAGPEVLSYQQQFIRFMAVSGKHRPLIPIPLPTRWISVWFLNVITSVPPTIAKALIQGLKHDLIADDRALRALIPPNADPLRSGGSPHAERRRAVSKLQRLGATTLRLSPAGEPEYGYYPKQAGCTVATQASRQALWQVVNQIGGEEGYFFGNLLWKTRGAMDLLVGHRLAKGAAAARLSANRRYGRQLEGNYRGGRKTAHPAIRYESARAGPIKLYH